MLQNKFLLFLIFVFNFIFSQGRKVDTVYVYEEIIIHDTLYIEKPLNTLNLEKVIFTKGENNEKDKLEITQNGKKIAILVDSTNVVFLKIKKPKSWFFGGKLHFGLADNSLFKQLNAQNSIGFGLGIWSKKQLFSSKIFLGIGFNVLYWTNSFSVDATLNDNGFSGYYFVNNKPLLFKSLKNKHFQAQIPLQFYYKIKKFMPSVGVFASISNYKSEFIGSSGSLPISLDETKSFTAESLQFGYLAEIEYAITKKISIGLSFNSGSSKNIIFTNKNDKNEQFKTQNSFKENFLLAQVIYKL